MFSWCLVSPTISFLRLNVNPPPHFLPLSLSASIHHTVIGLAAAEVEHAFQGRNCAGAAVEGNPYLPPPARQLPQVSVLNILSFEGGVHLQREVNDKGHATGPRGEQAGGRAKQMRPESLEQGHVFGKVTRGRRQGRFTWGLEQGRTKKRANFF